MERESFIFYRSFYDSIKGYWIRDGEVMGNGFTFSDYSADQLMERTCAALALYRESGDAALTAAYVQRFIAGTLEKMALWLRREDKDLPILFAGGVMSNRTIAADLRAALGNVAFAEPAFSADNAAGIAFLCRAELENREK